MVARRNIHLSDDENKKRAAISVVTATFNAAHHLPRLIASLREQTDRDFEWVVADGASSDGTLELLRAVTGLNIVISSQPDSGIYDALNRAIEISSGEYYIVSGADDFFYGDAIGNYRSAILRSHADIIVANAMYGQRCMQVRNGPAWIFGQSAFIAAHTLATAFKKDLHRSHGEYPEKYPVGGDQFFVLTAFKGGAGKYDAGFVAGEVGAGGVSSVDRMAVAKELFRIQLAVGSSYIIQSLMLTLRFLNIVIFKRRP